MVPLGGIREGKPHSHHPPSVKAYGMGGYVFEAATHVGDELQICHHVKWGMHSKDIMHARRPRALSQTSKCETRHRRKELTSQAAKGGFREQLPIILWHWGYFKRTAL